ncbi:uncharacterized protein DUF4352 [Georgenia soli]|uniref:Uncharacterized protein DUF4352 n=1 Tax=Georgenia soli TaxID=638953 RepID=A0A2A9ELN4_9MICO|nr:DUF4352 domain-containing protein [Georgenia soli]PFG39997.1 uncharacterized protein DUF4352 [Georgenia soli]
MTQQDPPWFPGQFGRHDDARREFTGDPYTDGPPDAEPYAPATLNTQATNPYGDLSIPPAGGPGPSLPDGAAAPTADGAADVRVTYPAAAQDRPEDPARVGGAGRRTSAPAAGPDAPAAPPGYEDFYEPGSVDRQDLRPSRGPRRRPSRRRRGQEATQPGHGPRPGRRNRRGRADAPGPADPAPGSPAASPAEAGGPTPTITVVPGGTAPARAGAAAGTGPAGRSAPAPGRDEEAEASGGRWRRNLLVLVLGGVIVSLVVGVVGGLGDEPDPRPTTAPTASPDPSPAPTTSPGPTPDPLPSPTAVAPPDGEVAVGAAVADGPFEAEVLGVSTGLTDLAGATATTTAEGEYVVVRLRVTATAPGTSYFLDIDQRLLDAGGTEHGPDPGAAMAVDGNRLWFAELEQGESAEGVVVFDVPVGTVPAAFVLHASDQSAGVPVELPTP